MTLDELLKNGLLEKVEVYPAPENIMDNGNRRYLNVFGKEMAPLSPRRMSGCDCAGNSICVVEAMNEKGEDDWYIVPGFAYNPEESHPLVHVWVRKGTLHFDPTWSLPCFHWDFKKLIHYQLAHPLNDEPIDSDNCACTRVVRWGNRMLTELKMLAEEWNFRLAGQL